MPTVSLDIASLVGIVFFIMLFIFTVYACMLGYHWFAYGSSTHTSRMSLGIFVAGGAGCFLVMGVIWYVLTLTYVG